MTDQKDAPKDDVERKAKMLSIADICNMPYDESIKFVPAADYDALKAEYKLVTDCTIKDTRTINDMKKQIASLQSELEAAKNSLRVVTSQRDETRQAYSDEGKIAREEGHRLRCEVASLQSELKSALEEANKAAFILGCSPNVQDHIGCIVQGAKDAMNLLMSANEQVAALRGELEAARDNHEFESLTRMRQLYAVAAQLGLNCDEIRPSELYERIHNGVAALKLRAEKAEARIINANCIVRDVLGTDVEDALEADLSLGILEIAAKTEDAQISLTRLQNAQHHLSNFLDTAEEMLGCGNEENPLLGITASIALLKRRAEAAELEIRLAKVALDTEETDERVMDTIANRENAFGSLLAVIHRDGGHHQAEHGTEKAINDAETVVVGLMQAREAAESSLADIVQALDVEIKERDPQNKIVLAVKGTVLANQDLHKALADAQAKAVEWLPIESAPKDGSEILVYGDGEMAIVAWSDVLNQGRQDWCIADTQYEYGEDESTLVTFENPSHFLPLPSSPTDAAAPALSQDDAIEETRAKAFEECRVIVERVNFEYNDWTAEDFRNKHQTYDLDVAIAQAIEAAAQALPAPRCEHDWKDARNEVVISGQICECGDFRAWNDAAAEDIGEEKES